MEWYFVAALLTILTSSQGILTTLSQSNGGYKYDYATVPFLAEAFKLAVSGLLLWRECQNSSPRRMTTEWKIKWKFMMLRFGVIFNMARLILDDFTGGFENGPWWQRLLNGYSITTWLVVLNLGSTGLLVSWLMKYADNIVKLYSTSMAMLLTMVLSIYLFNFKPTLQLFLGIIICMMSLHMYFAPSSMLIDLPSTEKSASENLNEVYVERRTNS
ncbi:hypothetical protein ACSBR1_003618 [Camellia fascicularis]